MSGLQVSPWKRYGHDRLYVNGSEGEKLGWFDRRTGQLHLVAEKHRAAVLEALEPHVRQPVRQRGIEGALRPEQDLAHHRPGECLRARVDELNPGLCQRLLARLLRQRLEVDSWRTGLVGEQRVGTALERLLQRGWYVLHSIPLARDVDIDHLLIGPSGAFSINTKCHRGANIWVGDEAVRIGGQSFPYVRKSRAEARRAATALTRASGSPVQVQPVLAFVDPGRLTTVPSMRDVRIVSDQDLGAFKRLKAEWTTDRITTVYSVARDRRTWANA